MDPAAAAGNGAGANADCFAQSQQQVGGKKGRVGRDHEQKPRVRFTGKPQSRDKSAERTLDGLILDQFGIQVGNLRRITNGNGGEVGIGSGKPYRPVDQTLSANTQERLASADP